MPRQRLRIALLGGVPASLGGGGLELQRDRTAEALRRRGHQVFHAANEREARPFDILHVFGSELDVCHQLSHWRRNPCPLVISPVIVAAPGAEERLLRMTAKVPLQSLGPRLRAVTLRRADLLIALTQHESQLLRTLAPRVPIHVMGNGVDPVEAKDPNAAELGLRKPYALLLGAVSARKRQAVTVRVLGRTPFQPVIVGGFIGSDQDRADFERAVSESNARWLGELSDPKTVRGLLRAASVMVHLSAAEGQSLAVLEALAEDTPVICSPLPANKELAQLHAQHVVMCASVDQLPEAIAHLPTPTGPAPVMPTWDHVAADLERHYRAVLNAGGSA